MFWKVNFRQPSAIDGLLDKEDCTLMEVLDEDDVLQECKTQNKKLIDFLCKPENLKQLVHYICDEPREEDEDKVRFKYPHLACEILTAEIFSIVDALVTSDDYLPMLWSFLDQKAPMNPLVGSFISKVLIMLLNQRTTLFLDYIKKREGFIDSFLNHLGTSAIMDLLFQMIVPADGDQNKSDLTTWLKEVGIIEKLLDCIHPEATLDQCINASQAICDMIRISRDSSQTMGPSALLTALESEETIEKLLNNMFATDIPPDWTIVNGILILLTTLEKRVSTGYSPTLGNQSEESKLSWDQAIERTLNSICPRIKLFHDLLSRKPSCEPVSFTVGKLDPPLGNMRLRVVQLFATLLQSQDVKIHREIIQHKTCSVLLDLFFQYPWNNFLHTYVEASISAAMTMNCPVSMETNDDTGQSDDSITLRQHLLKECALVQKILEGSEFNENQLKETRGCRQGYMGHLIRMANQIAGNTRALTLETASLTPRNVKDPEENKIQEDLDEETYKKWSDFISGTVSDMNRKNSTNLGGNRPINSSIEDSDEEFDPLNMAPDNELEKAFQQYQEIRFTNQFMDEFGADDDLDPAPVPFSTAYSNITSIICSVQADEEQTQAMAGFEAALMEKINQFDDESDSDEDESSTWVEKELSITSPPDDMLQSSDGEDEEGMIRRRRGFPSGSSDDDDELDRRGKRLIIEENKTTNGSNDLGVISWRSEFTTDEDLSSVRPIETSGGAMNWANKNPTSSTSGSSNANDWANFATFGQQASGENSSAGVPTVVTTTYVSVSELESGSKGDGGIEGSNRYTRLSSGDSDEFIPDENLLRLSGQTADHQNSSGSSEDDGGNSSDDERSASYEVSSEGDSGNPLIDPTSPAGTPTKPPQVNSDEETNQELTDNYRFLSSKGLLTDNSKVISKNATTPSSTSTEITNSTDDAHRQVDSSDVENSKSSNNSSSAVTDEQSSSSSTTSSPAIS